MNNNQLLCEMLTQASLKDIGQVVAIFKAIDNKDTDALIALRDTEETQEGRNIITGFIRRIEQEGES